MSIIGYIEKQNNTHSIRSFDQTVDPEDVRALMISRSDFDVQFIEIPPMRERDIEGFISYQIRSIFPGLPDITDFDFRWSDIPTKKIAVVFIMKRETLEFYREISHGNPLVLPYTLIMEYVEHKATEPKLISFWHPNWIEGLNINEKSEMESVLIWRDGSVKSSMDSLMERVGGESGKRIFFCSDNDREALAGYSREADQDSGPCEFFDLNTFLSKTNIRKAAVFQPKRKNTRINRKTRLSIMGVVALLLG